jgi:hypothetical protein
VSRFRDVPSIHPDFDIYRREHGCWFVAEDPSGPNPLLAEQIRQNMGNINEKSVGVQCMQRRNELIAVTSDVRVVAKYAGKFYLQMLIAAKLTQTFARQQHVWAL